MLKLLKSELITKKSFRLDQAHTHAPFTSSSARFKSKKVQARMAHLGPATYDVNSQSIAVQSIRDAILKKTMKGKSFEHLKFQYTNQSLICTDNTVTRFIYANVRLSRAYSIAEGCYFVAILSVSN